MTDYGLKPDALSELDRRNTPLLGYVETYIEQGPILEDMEQSLGVSVPFRNRAFSSRSLVKLGCQRYR